MIICLRHEVFLQSQKFGLQLFILNTVGFLPYRTEPSVKNIEVVDCDFIAVPLILPDFFFFLITVSKLL